MAYKSNINPMFRNKFSEDIFNQKYRHDGALTWSELASTLVQDVCKETISTSEKEQLTKYIEELKFIPGGRYLYYAGRPKKFFNNCYLLRAIEDTREDWADLSKRAETCLATGGGIGVDYSVYRASGSILHGTGGVASGPISKMLMINEIGRQIMQGGSRRSAIYASLNHQHGDALNLLKAKNWFDMPVGKTGQSYWDVKQDDFNFPCPLDMTNVSINYDTKWLLNYWNTGDVGDVFKENIRQALMTAEPGFSFNFFDKERETLRNACVTGDTTILTDKGYVPIQETIGKETVIWNGKEWSRVKPFSTGNNPIVTVKLSDGTSLNCTPYHEFVIAGGVKVTAEELKVGERLEKFSMPIVEGIEKYSIDAYSQGFYAGDGNTNLKHSWLYPPKYVCEKRLIGNLSTESIYKRKTWNHGVMYDKAFVPTNGSVDYKLNWLAGLLDSDGTVTRDINGNGLQIGSINLSFLEDTRLMLTTLGVQAKIVSGNIAGIRLLPCNDGSGLSKGFSCKESYRLLIGNTDTYNLMQLGLSTLRLQIHANKPQRDARRFVTVVSVEDQHYEDETFCFNESINHTGTFNGIVTGQCTEVTSEDDSDVCNLGSVNMSRINSISEFADVCNLATKFLICGTLVAELPYAKVYETREKNRRLGLGLMGMHEWLIQRKQKYEVTPELHRWLTIYRDVSKATANTLSNKLSISQPVACRAIAPTGTIGILAGTTTGIEPLFAVAYKRRYLKGTKWHYQYVVDGAAQEQANLYGIDPDTLDSALSMSNNFEARIKFQADVQDYVDMAISSTINLPKWGSEHNNEDTIIPFANTLASYAHRLRGFTCYPDGSRGGQPLTPVSYNEAKDKLGEIFEESLQNHDVCDITGRGGSCGT